jgi:hypothetical protein
MARCDTFSIELWEMILPILVDSDALVHLIRGGIRGDRSKPMRYIILQTTIKSALIFRPSENEILSARAPGLSLVCAHPDLIVSTIP